MVKIDIITGFLGSGKTTLIKKILAACEAENEKVVLLENEFGEVGIDGELVRRNGFTVVELTRGCICCTLKNDFAVTLTDILDTLKPDRVIFEPSGIFVPDEILDMLKLPDFAAKCRLNSLIAVVDSVHFLKQRSKYSFFFEKQTAHANLLILSKIQLVEKASVEELVRTLGIANPQAAIVAENWDDLGNAEIRQLLDPILHGTLQELKTAEHGASCCHPGHSSPHLHSGVDASHPDDFETVGFDLTRTLTGQQLSEALTQLRQGEFGEVLRGKGFVPCQAFEDGSRIFLEFSYVDGEFSVHSCLAPEGKACFIGKRLDRQKLQQLFL